MIICEGPDGSGKTTLVKRLCQDLGVEAAPRACTSEGGPVEDLAKWTGYDLINRMNHPAMFSIIDRYPLISDPIYGPLTRGRVSPHFDDDWYIDAWRSFIQTQPIIIFCLPDIEVVVENVMKENIPQMDGVKMNIRAIYWLYNNLFTRCRAYGAPQVMIWDYSSENAEKDYAVIRSLLTLEQRKREEYEW